MERFKAVCYNIHFLIEFSESVKLSDYVAEMVKRREEADRNGNVVVSALSKLLVNR